MSMVFCAIIDRTNDNVLCKYTTNNCYSEITHGIETDFEWNQLKWVLDDTTSSTGIMLFSSKDEALRWVQNNYKDNPKRDALEVLSFAEIDAIVEATLLGKDD